MVVDFIGEWSVSQLVAILGTMYIPTSTTSTIEELRAKVKGLNDCYNIGVLSQY